MKEASSQQNTPRRPKKPFVKGKTSRGENPRAKPSKRSARIKNRGGNSKFNPLKSIRRAAVVRVNVENFQIALGDKPIQWRTKMERVAVVRAGIPFESVEIVGKTVGLPVNQMLNIIDIPQTTYNNKKKKNALLDSKNSELLLILTELIDFGNEVFNQETEKFQRWLKKPNLSLGGNSPESFLDTVTGLQEVRNALNRIEYGNFA